MHTPLEVEGHAYRQERTVYLEINTPEAARELAKSLRKFCEERALSRLSVGHSLEVVAGLLGQPNWDTLSGLLKPVAEKAPSTSDVPALRAYFDVFACSEWGESPGWAMVELTPTFVARLREMQQVAKRHSLSEVREYSEPDCWDDNDVRLESAELVVCPAGDFWYRAPVRHTDYACETREIRLDQLLELANEARQAGKTYVVHSPYSDLESMLREAGELETDPGIQQD
jgi:hypothetical protein